ncbi:FAD-dependent oxidoreductase [Synergistaceae bacterium OttesenSCG-928-I11]|nr:FAD-dependent oxidoreductase [Synergistaceae bacterium OttesenSCG-928-I11]
MSSNKVIVIGGNAGGMSAASQLRRLSPDAEIAVYEKGPVISYSACGIPYYVGGMILDRERLIARTPESFAEKNIQVRTMHEVTAIDMEAKTVAVKNLTDGRTFTDRWDKLLIATGASRVKPPIPGIDADGIFMLSTVESGVAMRKWIETHNPRKALIVGGGYIGLEMADSLSCMMGIDLTILEVAPQLMATLDADMAEFVQKNLESRGVSVRLGEGIEEFVVRDGRVVGAVTKNGRYDADVVLMALGIVPNTKIASDVGIRTGIKGAIVVDETMKTSARDVWAAGDCVQSTNLITGKPMHLALGAVANKQGRAAAFSMSGQREDFPGVLGTAVCRVCGQEIARTGLLEREMIAEGTPYAAVTVRGRTVADYMDYVGYMHVKMIAETPSERIVGAQILGDVGSAKRIDTMAAVITAKMTLEEMLYLDFSYAPPISPLWDPIQQAARSLISKIRG